MKKIIILVLLTPLIALIVLVSGRYSKNRIQLAPYPYEFENKLAPLDIEAPILIIGDRYAKQLSLFSKSLAKEISVNLSKPIKIASIALDGEGAHRTLQKIKSLRKLPLVIIYLGGTQENAESKFVQSEIPKHLKNFHYFENQLIASALMIEPRLSKILYAPVKFKPLQDFVMDTTQYSNDEIQNRSILSFKIFENEIDDLFSYIKDRGAYLFALTAPLNLELKPLNPCNPKLDEVTSKLLVSISEKAKQEDFKGAYEDSKDLALMANTNANALYLHGKIALNLNKKNEAIKSFQMARIFDCTFSAGSPVYNAIITSKARKYDITLFDFQKMLLSNLGEEPLFLNDFTVQSIYMEEVTKALASRIKKLLKL